MEGKPQKPRGGTALLSDAASPGQLRVDLWNRIRGDLERLTAGQLEERRTEAQAHLRRLEEIERFWVYPGLERIEELRQLHRAGSLPQLRARVGQVADRLSELGDQAAALEETSPEKRAAHYFTVLLVGSLPLEQLR